MLAVAASLRHPPGAGSAGDVAVWLVQFWLARRLAVVGESGWDCSVVGHALPSERPELYLCISRPGCTEDE
jgi:hypothetical protein